MSDLICRKSMVRCQTPGMCAPHGGCQTPEVAPAFRDLLAERNSLAYLLKRFVDGEHDQDENQAERHMYHDEAQTLLAYLGGEVQSHTLVPDDQLRTEHEKKETLTAEVERLKVAAKYSEDVDAVPENQLEMVCYDLAVERDRLKIDNEALRKDVERYQRVRDIAYTARTEDGYRLFVELPLSSRLSGSTAKDFDTAIDASMGKGSGNG